MHQSGERSVSDEELGAVLGLASALIFPPEGQDVQAQLLLGICNMLNAETGAWVLIEDSTAALLTKKTLRADSTWLYQVDHLQGQGLLRDCLRSGQAVLANHLEVDPLFDPGLDGVAQMEVRSILCAPLIARGQTLGALEIINQREAGFAFPDLQLLLRIAAVAAHAMVGNQVIQQLKVTNADLEASRWELLRSRNTLRALVDSMPAGLYIVDQKYKLIAINMFRSNITGQPPRALVGRQCYEALFNRQEACPDCRVKETLTGGGSTSRFERRMIPPADLAEWEISTYPIVDDDEQVIQAILLEQDVTDKRRLESILIQSEKLAAVGQLAAGVAHEINNPLTAIIANAQLLQRSLPPDDEMQESVDLIIHAGARATQVVRSLLDFARKEPYALALTDINETLRRAMNLIQHELLARSIQLIFDPGLDLPLIMASQDHLQGVWLNLLLNGMDALEGQPGGWLKVSTRRIGALMRVVVADNGKGIPPERLSRIFEPFFTTKAPGRGTGLGLSLCHRIIKQHGGNILVESQVGVGTEFIVELPCET